MIDIQTFKDEMMTTIDEFESHWKSQNNAQPENYPETLSEEDWHEQFLCWLNEE